ncbi:hypothetical protein LX64_04696 [Chitinophaga skermanii]|uniref:Uncharacterized protein n=1 Tax=Chitinophaga skermanii TaxID=331697 RepID=A0A327Q4Q6_9BACT|nr:hypothetical protein [Chitinophaga skermanii]RAI98711.1 hypothetical protein LX64_04696 [Chitinophaga skermanii]
MKWRTLSLILTAIVVVAVACTKADIIEANSGNNPGGGGGTDTTGVPNPGNPGGVVLDTIVPPVTGDGAYLPYKVGMQLNYESFSVTTQGDRYYYDSIITKRIADSTVDGVKYITMKRTQGTWDSTVFARYDTKSYYQLEDWIDVSNNGAKTHYLMDVMYLSETQTEWNQTVQFGVWNLTYHFKLVGNNVNKTIGKKVFKNVKVVETSWLNSDGSKTPYHTVSFAQGFGILEIATGTDTTRLKSYFIP